MPWVTLLTLVLLTSACPAWAHPTTPNAAAPNGGPNGSDAAPSSAWNACVLSSSSSRLHDARLLSSNYTALTGAPARFIALLPYGVTGVSYVWTYGDGLSAAGSASSTRHSYTSAGLYVVCSTVTDRKGHSHDASTNLLVFPVASAGGGDPYGLHALLTGTIVANGSTGTRPTALIAAGGSVAVSVGVRLGPTTPSSTVLKPSFGFSRNAQTFGSLSNVSLSPLGVSRATATFSSTTPPGLYQLNYSLPTQAVVNGSTLLAWSNFTFSVIVGPRIAGQLPPVPGSSHPGRLNVAEVAPGGPPSLDPAIDNEPTGAEAISNVYETLIAPNQTAVGPAPPSFAPELATCVPGSTLCHALYHTYLVNGSNYTFVVNNRSQFYDPLTHASWGVWPTDVLFSFLRATGFANSPCFACNGGWMLGQTFLPAGDYRWDAGAHLPLNNSPTRMFAAVGLNVSGLCPPAALQPGQHGCVTFQLPPSPQNPAASRSVLEVLANPVGAAVEPCGWYSAPSQGAGIPYWTLGNVTGNGDAPCAPPGNGSFGVSPAAIPDTGFDSWEENGSTSPYVGKVRWSMVGSGPYALSALLSGASYSLQASPVWHGDPYCTFPGCAPPAGRLIPNVTVRWMGNATALHDSILLGSTDIALVPGNATPLVVNDVQAGLVSLQVLPTMTTYFDPLNLDFNNSSASVLLGRNVTAPGTLFLDLNLRQFLIHAYPYAAAIGRLYAPAGVETRFGAGGAIPRFMSGVDPRNVSWATGSADTNPTDVGGAAWWWSRAALDSRVGPNCTANRPCTFLITYVANDSASALADRLWASSVTSISGGAVVPLLHNVSWQSMTLAAHYSGPGVAPAAIATGLSLSTDFADPTDVTNPLYLPNSTYTWTDAVAQELGPLSRSGCSHSFSIWAARTAPIPVFCQGAAYGAMGEALQLAGSGPLDAAHALLYAEAEQIANDLALYVYAGQQTSIVATALWINAHSIAWNPLIGGTRGIAWYNVRYSPPPYSPLAVRGPVAWPDPASAGSALNLSGLAVGGAGGYSYNWSGLPAGCVSTGGSWISCTPSTSGFYNITLTVQDARGTSATGTTLALNVACPVPRRRGSFLFTE